MIFEALIKDVLLLIVDQLDLKSMSRMAQVNRVAWRLVRETKRYQAIQKVETSWHPFNGSTRLDWRIVQACQTDNLELLQYHYDSSHMYYRDRYLLAEAARVEAKSVIQWLLMDDSYILNMALVGLIGHHCRQGNLDFAQWLYQLKPTVMTPSLISACLSQVTDLLTARWLRSLLSD